MSWRGSSIDDARAYVRGTAQTRRGLDRIASEARDPCSKRHSRCGLNSASRGTRQRMGPVATKAVLAAPSASFLCFQRKAVLLERARLERTAGIECGALLSHRLGEPPWIPVAPAESEETLPRSGPSPAPPNAELIRPCACRAPTRDRRPPSRRPRSRGDEADRGSCPATPHRSCRVRVFDRSAGVQS